MGASSVTGVSGAGMSGKATTNELSKLANGPAIMFSGYVESEDIVVSPPAIGNTIVFPQPLQGSSDNYVVLLTTLNGGYAYVTDMDENDDGDFIGFSFATEAECSMMYLVAKVGIKPTV
jgi:hypothetical protein